MAKSDRTALLRKGEQLLNEWAPGLTPEVASIDRLRSLVGRDAASDVAIAARLGAVVDAASVAALRDIEKQSSDKNVHKEARRALYRLEQKGLAIPTEPAPSPAMTRTAQSIEGLLSPIDGRGDRLVWLLKARPTGVVQVYAVINDPDGLREVEMLDTTRKVVRSVRQSLRERNEIEMVDADWRYCDFLIDRATHWASARRQPITGDYGRLRTVLIGAPVQTMQPLIFAHLSADTIIKEPHLLRESASVLEQKEFRTWFFERETLAPFLDEVQQIQDSPIVLPEVQQQERLRLLREKAVEKLFGGELQESWVRRLEEMAYIFHASQRPEVAKRTLAAALGLQTSQHGGKDIPFCEALFDTGMRYWRQVEQQHESEEARGQLVVTPQQALRETQRR